MFSKINNSIIIIINIFVIPYSIIIDVIDLCCISRESIN